jgi:hypothetical protein
VHNFDLCASQESLEEHERNVVGASMVIDSNTLVGEFLRVVDPRVWSYEQRLGAHSGPLRDDTAAYG